MLRQEEEPNPLPSSRRIRVETHYELHASNQFQNESSNSNSNSNSSARWAAMADAAARFTRKMLSFAANGGRDTQDFMIHRSESTETNFYEQEFHDFTNNFESVSHNPEFFGDDPSFVENTDQELIALNEFYEVEDDPYLMATDRIMQETIAFLQKDERVTSLLGEPPLRIQFIETSGDTVNFDVFGPFGSGIVSVVTSIFTGDLISIRFYFQGRRYYLFNGFNTSGEPVTTTASVKPKQGASTSYAEEFYVRENDVDYDEAVRGIEVEILEGIRRSSSATKKQAIDADILDKDFMM